MAIGILKDGDFCKVVYGPPSAIKNQTSIHVKLVPGDMPSGRLVKEVREMLSKRVKDEALKRFIRNMPLDLFQQALPPKKAKIISD